MPLTTSPALSTRGIVGRGALAGGLGGLIAFGFARIFAEPVIEQAINYESDRDDAKNALAKAAGQPADPGGPDIFSRGVQSTIGIGTGMVLVGIGVGLLFAVVYALMQGRVRVRPRALAMLVAGLGFLTIYATPFVKYPANPPAIGHDDTITDRSGLYLAMVVGSVVFGVVAALLVSRLSPRLGTWNAVLVGGVVYVALSAVLMALLPSLGELASNVANYGPAVTETPQPLKDPAGHIVFPGFSADLLSDFRIYSFLAQALMWTVLGLVFGALAERGGTEETTRETVGSGDSPEPVHA